MGSGYSCKVLFEVTITVANRKAEVPFIIPQFFTNIHYLNRTFPILGKKSTKIEFELLNFVRNQFVRSASVSVSKRTFLKLWTNWS